MKITRRDPFSGKTNTLEIDVTQEQLDGWKAGQPIQYALPHLSADHREFLMTGIMPDEWEKAFGGDK